MYMELESTTPRAFTAPPTVSRLSTAYVEYRTRLAQAVHPGDWWSRLTTCPFMVAWNCPKPTMVRLELRTTLPAGSVKEVRSMDVRLSLLAGEVHIQEAVPKAAGTAERDTEKVRRHYEGEGGGKEV